MVQRRRSSTTTRERSIARRPAAQRAASGAPLNRLPRAPQAHLGAEREAPRHAVGVDRPGVHQQPEPDRTRGLGVLTENHQNQGGVVRDRAVGLLQSRERQHQRAAGFQYNQLDFGPKGSSARSTSATAPARCSTQNCIYDPEPRRSHVNNDDGTIWYQGDRSSSSTALHRAVRSVDIDARQALRLARRQDRHADRASSITRFHFERPGGSDLTPTPAAAPARPACATRRPASAASSATDAPSVRQSSVGPRRRRLHAGSLEAVQAADHPPRHPLRLGHHAKLRRTDGVEPVRHRPAPRRGLST